MSGLTKGVLMSTTFASLGALMFGIDNGWWGTVLGLSSFNSAFGTLKTVAADGTVTVALSASQQSAGTCLGYAGIMIGCAAATPIGRLGGRRLGIKVMGILALIGIVIEITASVKGYRYWQLVAGKIINSISMGIAANVVPVYQSELAPAKWRGLVINIYQTVQVVGVIIATACVYALNERTSDIAWQTPIGIQFGAPVLLLAGVFFMPESPRWLVFQGRTEEARDVLHSLHGATPGYSADEEVAILKQAYDEEMALEKPSIWAVFKGSDRRRALISMGVMCLQQAQGSSYMTNYIVLFLIALGMNNVFQTVMIIYMLYFAAILFSFYLPDRFGRRPMLLWGALICAVTLTITCAVNVGYGDSITDMAQKAALGMIFLWYFFFGLVWSPLVWITCTEVCSARAREPTLSAATFGAFATALIITLVSPYLQNAEYANMGASIGFIWAGFTFISIPFVYFCVPEMKGLTLEQIDYLFDKGTPTRKFSAENLFDDAETGHRFPKTGASSPAADSLKDEADK